MGSGATAVEPSGFIYNQEQPVEIIYDQRVVRSASIVRDSQYSQGLPLANMFTTNAHAWQAHEGILHARITMRGDYSRFKQGVLLPCRILCLSITPCRVPARGAALLP
jgi:hypothetical protein